MTHVTENMQAATSRRYGSPDVVAIESVPIPEAGEQEVLIKLIASTVNRTDCGFLRGRPRVMRLLSGVSKPRWPILGCELVGEVVQLGAGVAEYEVGDCVIAFKDDDYGFGCHAQFTTMNVSGMIAKIEPQQLAKHNLTPTQCAATLEGAHYALNAIRAAKVKPGDAVLVNGATGAIGSAAVQLLKHVGASVTGVCATPHLETTGQLGAEIIIDYTEQDFSQGQQRFKFVFDAVGKSTYGACKNILTTDGVYISTELGPYVQNPLYALWFGLTRSKRVMFPIPKNLNSDAQYLASLLHSGDFAPLIDSSYELHNTRSAYERAETGMKIGNIILNMPS